MIVHQQLVIMLEIVKRVNWCFEEIYLTLEDIICEDVIEGGECAPHSPGEYVYSIY